MERHSFESVVQSDIMITRVFLQQDAPARDLLVVVVNKEARLRVSNFQAPIFFDSTTMSSEVDTEQVCKSLDEMTSSMASARETIQSLKEKYVGLFSPINAFLT